MQLSYLFLTQRWSKPDGTVFVQEWDKICVLSFQMEVLVAVCKKSMFNFIGMDNNCEIQNHDYTFFVSFAHMMLL